MTTPNTFPAAPPTTVPSLPSPVPAKTPDTEREVANDPWSSLHRPDGTLRGLIERARLRLGNPSAIDLVAAALAGVAVSYLVFTARRPHGLRQMLLGSLVPYATKGTHDAYNAISHSKPLRKLGRRAAKLHSPW